MAVSDLLAWPVKALSRSKKRAPMLARRRTRLVVPGHGGRHGDPGFTFGRELDKSSRGDRQHEIGRVHAAAICEDGPRKADRRHLVQRFLYPSEPVPLVGSVRWFELAQERLSGWSPKIGPVDMLSWMI